MLNRLIFIESWPPCVCVDKKFSFKIHRHSVLQVLFYSFDTYHAQHIRSDQFTLVWAGYKQCGLPKNKMKVRLLWYFWINCVWWLWWSGTGNTFLAVLWLSTLPDSSKKLEGLGIPLLHGSLWALPAVSALSTLVLNDSSSSLCRSNVIALP